VHILRALPFRETPSTVDVAGQTIAVRAYQVIVWVSLSVGAALEDARRFPAVLDTAHNHNFSLREEHLNWAGLQAALFEKIGDILVNRQEVPLRAGYIWIHRNRPGTAQLLTAKRGRDLLC
jgi:hypothetical protein